jgi:hypothetical protein
VARALPLLHAQRKIPFSPPPNSTIKTPTQRAGGNDTRAVLIDPNAGDNNSNGTSNATHREEHVTFDEVLASGPKFRVPGTINQAQKPRAGSVAFASVNSTTAQPQPRPAHPHAIGRRLSRASGGWPISCVVQASLSALPWPLERCTVLKFEPGAEVPHPVTACAHLVEESARRSPSRAGAAPRRRFLRAPAAAVDNGKLRWGASLGAAYDYYNSTQFDSKGAGHKTVFYDGRVTALMGGPGVVNATVYAAFLQLNDNLVTRRCACAFVRVVVAKSTSTAY